MGFRPCKDCKGTGRIGQGICPVCMGKRKIRQVFSCPVCGGRYYVPRDPPVMVVCPHCGSMLDTNWDYVHVVKRGSVPIPRPGSKAPLGALSGSAIGLAVGGPVGGAIGFVIGGLFGLFAEAPLEATEVTQ